MLSTKEYLKSEYIALHIKITVQELKYILGAVGVTQTGSKDELLEKVCYHKHKILNIPDNEFEALSMKLIFLSDKLESADVRHKLVRMVEKFCLSQKQFVYFSSRNLKSILQSMDLSTNMQNAKLVESLRKNKSKISSISNAEWVNLQKQLNFKGNQQDLIAVVTAHEKIFKVGLTDSDLTKRYKIVQQQRLDRKEQKFREATEGKVSDDKGVDGKITEGKVPDVESNNSESTPKSSTPKPLEEIKTPSVIDQINNLFHLTIRNFKNLQKI